MKAFGGDIICESELGKWTKFSLLFPVVDVGVSAITDENGNIASSDMSRNHLVKSKKESLTHKQESDSQQYLHDLKSKKILIADDQELNLLLFAKKLESLGMEVTKVKDGKELIEAYKNSLVDVKKIISFNDEASVQTRKSQFDIIITDINMPILSGTDAAKKIREIESENSKNNTTHKKRIPIIALTGISEAAEITSFFEFGMTDYFIKGDDVSKLIKIIAMCLKAESKL